MNRTHHILFLALSIGLLAGCTQDEPAEPLDLGYAYWPKVVGHYVDYQVDSMWRDDHVGISGQVSYVLREVIAEEYTDPGGRPSQRIERFVQDSMGVWTIRDVWTQTSTTTAAERTEENDRLLKMVFPVRTGQYWNLNTYNTADELELTYDAADVSWSANGLSFSTTALVGSTFFNNLVDTMVHEERYAKNVGLVYKRWVVSNTQTTFFPPPSPPLVETKGNYLTMTVIGYGEL